MAGPISIQIVFYAIIAGVLPSLVWLIFWLREDSKRPEPRGLISRTFLFGMVAVVIVLPLERMANAYFPGLGLATFASWAIIEEVLKFGAAFFGGLISRSDDEPLDPMIYMITAALGFAALENALFLASPFASSQLVAGVLTGSLRFMGASLVHVVASGIVGFTLALAFYKAREYKLIYGIFGLALAIVFHTAFNIMIVNQESLGGFAAFVAVWLGAAALLLSFEKVKTVAKRKPLKL